jgi:hypothetical protein
VQPHQTGSRCGHTFRRRDHELFTKATRMDGLRCIASLSATRLFLLSKSSRWKPRHSLCSSIGRVSRVERGRPFTKSPNCSVARARGTGPDVLTIFQAHEWLPLHIAAQYSTLRCRSCCVRRSVEAELSSPKQTQATSSNVAPNRHSVLVDPQVGIIFSAVGTMAAERGQPLRHLF